MLGSNGHLAIWLHGYPDGHPQSLKNSPNLPEAAHCENGHTKKKTRFWLPKSDWFQKLLQAQKVPQVCEYHNRPFLKALAWARMGVVWKNKLTQLKTEELQGFKFVQFPTDFFSFEIVDALAINAPFPMATARSQQFVRGGDGVVRVREEGSQVVSSTMTLPFEAYLPGTAFNTVELWLLNTFEGESSSAAQVLQKWYGHSRVLPKQCLVVPVVQPLLQLILACLPEPVQAAVGPPDSDPPVPEGGDLSGARLLYLIRLIQSWSPAVLQHAATNHEDVEQKQAEVEGAVSWLMNVLANLPGENQIEKQRGPRAYRSSFLVKCMLMSRLVPSHVCLKQFCVDALGLVFP